MIMTAHIRKVPSQLEYVLEFIRKLKESESSAAAKQLPPHLNPASKLNNSFPIFKAKWLSKGFPYIFSPAKKKEKADKRVTAMDVLEYVCWLADANKMFEVALQTYDLELVALVGQQTQKVSFLFDFSLAKKLHRYSK
jgi:elongator complex protein 1